MSEQERDDSYYRGVLGDVRRANGNTDLVDPDRIDWYESRGIKQADVSRIEIERQRRPSPARGEGE